MRKIGFAVSGIKHYENEYYKNSRSSFTALSVTGTRCECRCAHCNAALLRSMADVSTIGKFISCVDKAAGCGGILVSGGSGSDGSVPLLDHAEGIRYAKKKGLKVLVHTGLLDHNTTQLLKSLDVDQILLDVIGSVNAIRSVYGINKTPDDYFNSMLNCKTAGLDMAPHLVIGLDFGKIEGEYKAIDMISKAGAENIVLVVLIPKRGTKMEGLPPPPLQEVIDVFRYASEKLANCSISLGCARPWQYSGILEKAAIQLGFSAIAYPREETIRYAKELGLETFFFEACCSLAGGQLLYGKSS